MATAIAETGCRRTVMEWIDETLAIGSWRDAASVDDLRKERIDLILDARPLFVGGRSSRIPLVDRVYRSADLMVKLSEMNVKVLIHCYHGRDRSPFVAMLYVSRRYGLGYQEAYELVKKKRPRTVFHPEWIEALGGGPDDMSFTSEKVALGERPVRPA